MTPAQKRSATFGVVYAVLPPDNGGPKAAIFRFSTWQGVVIK